MLQTEMVTLGEGNEDGQVKPAMAVCLSTFTAIVGKISLLEFTKRIYEHGRSWSGWD
jgi:hypothetical protein